MITERVKAVAQSLYILVASGPPRKEWVDRVSELLSDLPELKDEPWVLCSDRMPPVGNPLWILIDWRGCKEYVCASHTGNGKVFFLLGYGWIEKEGVIAWKPREIPKYVPPESELVRRFMEKVNDKSFSGMEAISALKEVEKEMADGK